MDGDISREQVKRTRGTGMLPKQGQHAAPLPIGISLGPGESERGTGRRARGRPTTLKSQPSIGGC